MYTENQSQARDGRKGRGRSKQELELDFGPLAAADAPCYRAL